MYKGIGESAYNDGLFSQAAPFQEYQASVSQFADGALGAFARLAQPGRVGTGVRRSISMFNHASRRRGVSGPGQSYQDGTLGHTFLPAFNPQEMRGLGYAYRDGVLGDATQEAACTPVRMCMSDILSTPQPMDRALKDPFNQLVAVSIVGLVGYLIYKR